jgi:site-specific recombinase XerD
MSITTTGYLSVTSSPAIRVQSGELSAYSPGTIREAIAVYLVQDLTNPQTRRAYARWLGLFAELAERGHAHQVADLTQAHLDGWAYYLREADRGEVEKIDGGKPGPYSPASRAQALVAVRSFPNWLDEAHDLVPVPEKRVRRSLSASTASK